MIPKNKHRDTTYKRSDIEKSASIPSKTSQCRQRMLRYKTHHNMMKAMKATAEERQEWCAIVRDRSEEYQESYNKNCYAESRNKRRNGCRTDPSLINKIGRLSRSNSNIRTDPGIIAKIKRRSRSYDDKKTLEEPYPPQLVPSSSK